MHYGHNQFKCRIRSAMDNNIGYGDGTIFVNFWLKDIWSVINNVNEINNINFTIVRGKKYCTKHEKTHDHFTYHLFKSI